MAEPGSELRLLSLRQHISKAPEPLVVADKDGGVPELGVIRAMGCGHGLGFFSTAIVAKVHAAHEETTQDSKYQAEQGVPQRI